MFESPLQFPSLVEDLFQIPEIEKLSTSSIDHAPRFLLLYGSLRERSFSRLLTFEAARLLTAMGGEVKIFDPTGLPLVDSAPDSHPKVKELRQLALWAEGMVWTSPERHGA
jgi:arsenic resistance protein ArsH